MNLSRLRSYRLPSFQGYFCLRRRFLSKGVSLSLCWLLLGCPSQNEELDAKLNQATAALNAEEYGRANTYLDEAEALAQGQHERAEVLYRRAEVHAEAGDHRSAAELYLQVESQAPYEERKARALLDRAEQLLLAGEKEQAISEYERCFERYPDSASARTALLRSARLKADRPGSSAELAALAEGYHHCKTPRFCEESGYEYAQALRKFGTTAAQLEEEKQVLQALEEKSSVKRSSLLDDIRLRLAELQAEAQNLDAALALLEKIAVKPKKSWITGTYARQNGAVALYLQGELLQQQDKRTEARKSFERVQKWYPDSLLLEPAALAEARLLAQEEAQEFACKMHKKFSEQSGTTRWIECLKEICQAGKLSTERCDRRPSTLPAWEGLLQK